MTYYVIYYITYCQGWGQIHFIKYKYKYIFLKSANTNINIFIKFVFKYNYKYTKSAYFNTNTYLTPSLPIVSYITLMCNSLINNNSLIT